MALEVEEKGDNDDKGPQAVNNGRMEQSHKEEEEADNEEEEDEDEDEPRLNYTSLTRYLRPLYRNGDATSTFLVAGDKMVG
jgi:vacuolar protein sorting-associated protein 41